MVHVLSQKAFDEKMKELGVDDSNVAEHADSLFISIIGTKDSLDYYLHESGTKHYFAENHPNVINLEFDDVDSDTEYNGVPFKAITDGQCDDLIMFISSNIGNGCDKEIWIHCRAGVSRSRAVAEFIARHYSVEYDSNDRKLFYHYLNHGVLRKLEASYRANILGQ